MRFNHVPHSQCGYPRSRCSCGLARLVCLLYWDNHLEGIAFIPDLFHLIRRMFKENLLFWFEALSVTGKMRFAMQAITILQRWLFQNNDGVILVALFNVTSADT
jgi:hypothetical protein